MGAEKAIAMTGSAPTAVTLNADGTAEAKASRTPEIVVALCGPIGSPLHQAAEQIKNTLSEFGYATEAMRLSDFIRLNAKLVDVDLCSGGKLDQIRALIRAGDLLREKYGHDILAKLAVAKIRADRQKAFGSFKDVAKEQATPEEQRIDRHRICHVIDSIKNRAELDLLRLIYGDALVAIGVFSPLEVRRRNLLDLQALSEKEINALIDLDSGEEVSHGQSVRDTFPRCDLFLRVDHGVTQPSEERAVAQLVEKLRRFFNLLFRTAIVTPSADETAMYAAASAARNSSCLSRQVGAAVTTSSGELLSVGWNEVPQSGGGVYGKPKLRQAVNGNPLRAEPDFRCFALGGQSCHNDAEKSSIAKLIVEALVSQGFVDASVAGKAALAVLGDTRVKDLIEFSRAVHAEMHAILSASRIGGERVIGGRLFVTTYPCHSCARHLVAAGIANIVYIEPYRKSLATRLHGDSVSEMVDSGPKVSLLQFDGVAPRRFIELFEAGDRKINGALRPVNKRSAAPSTTVNLRAIPRLEEAVVAEIDSKMLILPKLLTEGS
jgi:deoxycytidylate deaminase